MKCKRCQGLMIKDQLFDPDGPFLHIEILRCLNCGGTVYPKANEQPVPDGSNDHTVQAA